LPPTKTSGIRIGTPAISTRGFKEDDAKEVARLIIKVAENQENLEVLNEVKEEVRALTTRLPLYK
jgi:Glycine/serine hydroxymethyltransferase